ncbi:MAG: RimK family alpha-L-glutamate ligase [Deltaproteobacteria bacterium]|nr:RimK family alpha-L-glutamate ligase [Deltaproteobacteria bacterium]
MIRHKVIALEARLRDCRNVYTLGVRPNFSDYPEPDAEMIRSASKIYYPSAFYADLLDAMGIKTFPSYHTYKCVQDKIKQSALFNLLNIPHPRTRVYYGPRQKGNIRSDFPFPFVGKIARGSSKGTGVFLISNTQELDRYLEITSPAYIQSFIPAKRDIRVVVIGTTVVHAYWRIAGERDFRTNLARGGRISLDSVPPEALELALETARKCRWNDVGIDIICRDGCYYVLEANMKYGKEGFREAGIDYVHLMETLIENEKI